MFVCFQEAKDSICEDITKALDELIESVKEHGIHTMAKNIVDVKHKLGTGKRYSIVPELDRHIDIIIENSRAVAHVSHDEYKEIILRECGEASTQISGPPWDRLGVVSFTCISTKRVYYW